MQPQDFQQAQNFQQQRNELVQNAYDERLRLQTLYRQGQINEDKYREELRQINSKVNNLKELTSFSKPKVLKKQFGNDEIRRAYGDVALRSMELHPNGYRPRSSQPSSSKLSYYDSIVTTEDEAREKLGLRDTGNGTWTHESLINDPYGHYKRKAEKERKTRKEKLAPYGKTLPEGSRYFYDHWQAPLGPVDSSGNKTITGWSQIPDESYVNKTPTVQTPQLNF